MIQNQTSVPENSDVKQVGGIETVSENNTQGSSHENPASPERKEMSSPIKLELEKSKSLTP